MNQDCLFFPLQSRKETHVSSRHWNDVTLRAAHRQGPQIEFEREIIMMTVGEINSPLNLFALGISD